MAGQVECLPNDVGLANAGFCQIYFTFLYCNSKNLYAHINRLC